MSKKHQFQRIAEIKERAGRFSPAVDSVTFQLERLRLILDEDKSKKDALTDFIPVRIATCIEVVVRHVVRQLVDSGSPYAEKAEKFSKLIKFDFLLAHAIHGKRITLGDIVGDSISTNSLEQIVNVFDILIDSEFRNDLINTVSRGKRVLYGVCDPIITNTEEVFRDVGQIFDIRHILVHELPAQRPYDEHDLGRYIDSAQQFLEALVELIARKLHGDYPVTQSDMNRDAFGELRSARDGLAHMIWQARKLSDFDRTRFWRAQRAWKKFCHAEAALHAGLVEGGSMEPMVYALSKCELTQERLKQVLWWLEREEGEC